MEQKALEMLVLNVINSVGALIINKHKHKNFQITNQKKNKGVVTF